MSQENIHRVVITGMGWVTPLGHDIESVWQRLQRGDSGISQTTHFDASTFPTTFSGEVRDYDFRDFVKNPEYHQHPGLNTQFALGAARLAWKMAGLDDFDNLNRERAGIYLGSGEGTLDFDNYVASHLAGLDTDTMKIHGKAWIAAARDRLSMWSEVEQEANMTLNHVAMELNISGPAYNCLTACAASTQAIGEAAEILRRGDTDLMVSGGAHSMIHPLGVTGFNRLTALSNRNDDPTGASRPFNLTRDGFVLGEGSGMIILETLEHAQNRGANIIAEIVGFGSSADAYRITDIHPEGRGPIAAMQGALEQAGIGPQDVDYISAHGTGTKENDSVETRAVKSVFAEHASTVRMSSIKSMMGHLIAAAGAVELITCTLAIRDNILPPTINLDTPDPECDLDYVPNKPYHGDVTICLSNSFGFGGQNDALVVREYRD